MRRDTAIDTHTNSEDVRGTETTVVGSVGSATKCASDGLALSLRCFSTSPEMAATTSSWVTAVLLGEGFEGCDTDGV